MANTELYTCICCGYKTLAEQPPGSFEICSVCGWEDDLLQVNDPDFRDGMNTMTLRKYQKKYLKGEDVKPTKVTEYTRDEDWTPLSSNED